MPGSRPVTGASRFAAVWLVVPSLLVAPRARAAQPAYTLAARIRTGYRLEVAVRVHGAGPYWCTLDSGAGGGFLLDKRIGEAAGLHGTRTEPALAKVRTRV